MEEARKQDLKGWAAIIVAVTGVVTAVVHRPPEDAAKASYIELTAAILQLQDADRKHQADLEAQRAFLDSYVHSHEAVITISSASPPPAPPPTATSTAVSKIV